MCIGPPRNPQIVPFSKTTWDTFKKYVSLWESLEGEQAEIANQFVREHTDYAKVRMPTNGGYHRACYNRFTDSQRVRRVLERMKKTSGKYFSPYDRSTISF